MLIHSGGIRKIAEVSLRHFVTSEFWRILLGPKEKLRSQAAVVSENYFVPTATR